METASWSLYEPGTIPSVLFFVFYKESVHVPSCSKVCSAELLQERDYEARQVGFDDRFLEEFPTEQIFLSDDPSMIMERLRRKKHA